MTINYYYTQVSPFDHGFEKQLAIIKKLNIAETNIYIDNINEEEAEKESYYELKEIILPDDILNIESINALGEKLEDVVAEWKDITSKGIDIRVLDMPLIDTTLHKDILGNHMNEVIIQLFTYMLEQEKGRLKKKQAKGIREARYNGVIMGRPKAQLPDNFNQIYFRWKSTQITAVEAMKQLGLKKSTFYKLIKQYEENFKKSKLGSN